MDFENTDRAAAADALEQVAGGLQRAAAGLTALAILVRGGSSPDDELDPADPRNKQVIGGVEKLTRRGVEVCYRLFDAGKSRYAVSQAMGISYGAATYRLGAWEKAGGRGRERELVD